MKKDHNFKKQFGQNFLNRGSWTRKILEISNITSDDTVLEIGPGDGRVTEELLKVAKMVIAIEIDDTLIDFLNEKFKDYDNFHLIHKDVLTLEPDDIFDTYSGKIKIIGSLPYNISKVIIKKFLESDFQVESMTVIIQKEVAQNYTTKVPDATFLSNYVKVFADVSYHGRIPKADFHPKPKVDGGILHFQNINHATKEKIIFKNFIRQGFTHPRKKVSSVLNKFDYNKEQIEEFLIQQNLTNTARASELSFEMWDNLYRELEASS